LTIGRGGTGTVDVNNGGQILIAGASNPFPGFQLGRDVGAQGTLLLTGAGSRIEITSDLTGNLPGDDTGFIQIGREGTGTVEVRSGAQIINSANGITFVGRKPGSEGTLIVDGGGSVFVGGEVVHVGSDFDFVTFQAIPPGGDGTVAQSNGGQILGDIVIGQVALDDSAIVQVASTAITNALLSATGDGILDTGDGTYDTGGELEEAPGLEEAVANEGESEDSSDSSTNSLLECR
jgi:hypothetical protein